MGYSWRTMCHYRKLSLWPFYLRPSLRDPNFTISVYSTVHVIISPLLSLSIYWPPQGRMGKKKERRKRQNRENCKNCRTQKVLSPGLLDSPLVMFIDQGDSNLGPLPIVQLTTNNVMEIITHIFEKIANYSNIFTDSSVLENVNMYIYDKLV